MSARGMTQEKGWYWQTPSKVGIIQSIIASSKRYVMVDGLLYRKVRTRDGEELRPCAPSGTVRQIFGLVKQHPVRFRRELLHHYHS